MASCTADRRIVVGVDSSGRAAFAALWAAREAADRGIGVLHLVHADDTPDHVDAVPGTSGRDSWRTTGARLLETVARQVRAQHPGLRVTTEVSDIGAALRLVELSGQADLTVAATRGCGGHAGLLLGSVSLNLAGCARGPAAVVRGDWNSAPRNEIVLGVAPGEPWQPVEYAFASAAELGAEIHAIRAWSPPRPGEAADGDLTEEARVLLKEARSSYPGVPVTVDVLCGEPVAVLTEAARGSRLLVIGAHRDGPPASPGVGRVVYGLLSHAATPVASSRSADRPAPADTRPGAGETRACAGRAGRGPGRTEPRAQGQRP
ncbi:MAG TPA: universal stress protein [Actinocrinis sp.]|nr:universal stress protein [Actinocrinis sp.]